MTPAPGEITGWRRVRLGDVLSLEYGKSLPSSERDPYGKFPVAGSNGPHGNHNRALVSSPGIVVGRKGSAGRVYWYDEDFWPIDTTYYVVPKVSLEMRWVYFLLHHLRLQSIATTTGVPGLNRSDAYALEINFPPVSEQRRIVDILDQIDRVRRLHGEAKSKACRILPALFLKEFGDPGKNPLGWQTIELGSAISSGPQKGLYKPASFYGRGTKILRIAGFYDGEVADISSFKRVEISTEETEKYTLEEADIIVNCFNSEEYLGKSAIIPELAETLVFGSNIMRFKVDKSQLLPGFILAHLQTPFTRAHMLSKAKRAVNLASINQQDIRNLTILRPPLAEQTRFVAASAVCREVSRRYGEQQDSLEQLSMGLSLRALSGTLTDSWRRLHIREL